MTHPLLALRAAILARIAGDAVLAGLLGAAVIHDEPPRGAAPLYALFGEAEARDWSTGDHLGHEHRLEIAVHARPGSAAGALAAVQRLAALLHEADLAPPGQRLVLLRAGAARIARDERTGLTRAVLQLTALTETA